MTETSYGAADLPWLAAERRMLAAARTAGRLPHALLLHDPAAAGGELLGWWIAQLALCQRPGEEGPCGECAGCRRVAAGAHPDLYVASPLEDSAQVRIEQIRELCAALSLTAHAGAAAVALVVPADAMNVFAANALLKTLEEPRPGTVLVLVAAQPSRLPVTIASRCQRIHVRAPARPAALAWLQGVQPSPHWPDVLEVLGGSPLRALAADPAELTRLREEVRRTLEDAARGEVDPAAAAERWSRNALPERLMCFETWLTLRIRSGLVPARENAPTARPAHLSSAAPDMNIPALFRVLDGVRELKGLLTTPINKSLALERLLWQLRRAARAAAA